MLAEFGKVVGIALAIGFGVVFLWWPPAAMANQASTVGTGIGFITAGLGALGITVTLPLAQRAGYYEGFDDHASGKSHRYRK